MKNTLRKTELINFLTASLQRKLMLALMAIAAAVIGMGGIYLLSSQQQNASAGLDTRAVFMANLLSKNLSLPLWDKDQKAIQNQLEMVMSDPEIYSVALYESEQKEPLNSTKRAGQAVDGIMREAPILHVSDQTKPPVELGRVRIVYTRSYLYQALRKTRMMILAGILFLLAALSAATYILLRRMVQKPIRELLTMTDRIADGDFEVTIPVTSRDEIGLLSEKFNSMTDKLKQTMDGLNRSEQNYRSINVTLEEELSQRRRAETELQRYQLNLEDLVKSRTDELGKAIDQMNAEIADRNNAEEALKQANENLESSTADLQKKLGDMENTRKGMLNILEDLDAAKKETEATMQQINVMSQEQLAIFESLTLGIALIKNRIILRGNSKLGELFGRSLDEMVGQTTRIWYKNDEEYSGPGASTYEDLQRQAIHQREQELPRKDGSLFWCLFRARAIDAQDISQGIVCVLEDITERRQAEAALRTSQNQMRTLVDSFQSLIFMKDADGRYLQVNAYHEYITGIPDRDVLGHTDFDIMPRELAEKIVAHDREVMDARKAVTLEVPGREGTNRVFLTNKVPLIDENGEVYGICGISTDITDRKAAEKEMKEQMEELERFSRLTINREGKMIQLKEEINTLREQMGKEQRYKIVE